MCQGAIISLVKFQKGKRTKSVVLSGIGSHSDLLKENKVKLEKLGWKDDPLNQEVFSIESDFFAWNKFCVIAGEPNRQELKVFQSAYKTIAGNATALIRHVKRCGKIDGALVALLTDQAWEQYKKVRFEALDQYQKARAQTWEQYKKEAKAQTLEQYEKAKAQALEQYEKAKAQAWTTLFRQRANRIAALR